MVQNNSRVKLEQLLVQMIEQPEREAEIAKVIDDIFGQNKAIMVLDMSGFCRTAREHSIVLVLSLIYQMQLLAKPCIEAQGGQIIKAEADNLFCLFDSVIDALQASRQIHENLKTANLSLPQHCQLDVSAGVGYGHILNIEDKDIFGDEVNVASKLGEDIARKGEILLTENAYVQLQETGYSVREESVEISGFNMRYHVVQHSVK